MSFLEKDHYFQRFGDGRVLLNQKELQRNAKPQKKRKRKRKIGKEEWLGSKKGLSWLTGLRCK
jgi:hypothetical protein